MALPVRRAITDHFARSNNDRADTYRTSEVRKLSISWSA